MRFLLDTNVLLRAIDEGSAAGVVARAAVLRLEDLGHKPVVVPQNLYEFWVSATRPRAVNGLGLSPSATREALVRIRESSSLLPDSPAVLGVWEDLVVRHACLGKLAHDARLVAAMKVHAVPAILTFNAPDFRRFDDLTVLDPAEVVASTP